MAITSNDKNEIVGAWRLKSSTILSTTGISRDLWSNDIDGIIIYLANGYMSVHLSDVNRPKFENDDPSCATFAEIKLAFERYITYFGTYKYNQGEGIVHHHITQALFPNWSGITQLRYATINQNELTIKTTPLKMENTECTMELVWQRI